MGNRDKKFKVGGVEQSYCKNEISQNTQDQVLNQARQFVLFKNGYSRDEPSL